tara:strand:- start:365 stop:1912 length:1548 start_codon:yes stop_codon:yes gene_type:complete
MADKVVIEAEVKSNIKAVSKETKDLTNNFGAFGVTIGGIKSKFKEVGKIMVNGLKMIKLQAQLAGVGLKQMFGGKIVRGAKNLFNVIKLGVAATGIGLLIVAFTGLIQYFKDSEDGASKFKQITSQLGVVVGNVSDIISNLGKAVFKLVTGDFKGFKNALGEVTEGVKDFGETTRKEMAQANQLEKDRLALQKFEREAIVEKARTEKNMMELRLKARDEENFSTQERLGFMREANKLAGEQLEKDLHVAREKLRFQTEENSFSKSTQANLDAEAQLQAQVFQIERSNFSERKRLKSEEQALVKQAQAQADAIAKEKQNIIDIEDKRIADEKKKADDAKAAADKKAADAEIAEAKRVADEKIAILKAEENFKKATISKGFGAAAAMAGENAALSKGVAAAQVVYNTQQGIMAAMGATSVADKLLPYPLRLANAIATGVMGAAALSKIMSTEPTGGGASASSSVGGGGGGTPAPQMMSGAFELGGGIEPEPVQAFVLTDSMTNSQNQLANIRRRATI